jgi:hypothetical protein
MAARRRRKSQSKDPVKAEEAETSDEVAEELPIEEEAEEPMVAPEYRYITVRTMGGRLVQVRERINHVE